MFKINIALGNAGGGDNRTNSNGMNQKLVFRPQSKQHKKQVHENEYFRFRME
jgi:hypothetical protein